MRFTLSAAAKVTLSVRRIKLTVSGQAGANRVRFKPRLKPGAYRLRALQRSEGFPDGTLAVGTASVRFRVVR